MMKTLFRTTGLLLIIILVVICWFFYANLKDHYPGYKSDLKIVNQGESELKIGFAAVSITPEVPDRWVDANGDAKYNPKDGDTFTDGNGNGKFDPVWIAGFSGRRAANGIHDELWARAMLIDDGKTRIAIVSLDAIGFMNNDVIEVRKRIESESGINYIIITSTHTHEGPDLIGLWGKTPFASGINPDYREFVRCQIVVSIEKALENIRPAKLLLSEDMTGAVHLLKDTREPVVLDAGLRFIRAIDKENGSTLGSIIAWADHPETLWSKNLLITSDFPHFVREGVEKGIFEGDSLIRKGIGGIAVYINGALGGLMTTHPGIKVTDPVTGGEYNEPSFEKAQAQGRQIALLALNSMEKATDIVEMAGISIIARTIILPIENRMFRLATTIGTIDRGTSGWMKMRSELAVCNIGPISFATLPGECYPEIINGTVEAPEGRDFNNEPAEVPSVRDMMIGRYKFVFGLANDEIGYIIPKSQWDVVEPYTYNRKDSQYGEENSLGPDTAPLIHKNLKEMFSELNNL